MVGVRGFEPPASASRTQRSSQTEPHPEINGLESQTDETVNLIADFKFSTIKTR